MRAFKIIAAALLFAAVAVTTLGGPDIGDTREHILGAGSHQKREHILGTDADSSAKREHILGADIDSSAKREHIL